MAFSELAAFTPTPDLPSQIATYTALGPIEQATVQILAIAYDTLPRTTILVCLKQLGFRRGPDGKALSNDSVLALLRRLVAAGGVQLDGANYRCQPLLANEVMERIVQGGQLPAMAGVIAAIDARYRSNLRDLRLLLFKRDFAGATRLLQTQGHPGQSLRLLLEPNFDERWLRTWSEPLIAEALSSMFEQSLLHLVPAPVPFAFLEAFCAETPRSPQLRALLALELSLRGRAGEVPHVGVDPGVPETMGLDTWLGFLRRDKKAASADFGKRKAEAGDSLAVKLGTIASVFSLLEQGDREQALTIVSQYRQRREQEWVATSLDLIGLVVGVATGRFAPDYSIKSKLETWTYSRAPKLERIMRLFARAWLSICAGDDMKVTHALRVDAGACGYLWLVEELDDLIAAIEGGGRTGRGRLLDVMVPSEPWMRALDALDALVQTKTEAPKTPKTKERPAADLRMAWMLELRGSYCSIRPVEQKRGARGEWTQGRRVAMERLHTDWSRMSHLSDQDRAIAACIDVSTYVQRGYPETTYSFDEKRALRTMIGHPQVYLEGATPAHVELVEGSPALSVIHQGDQVVMQFVPTLGKGQEVAVVPESASRIRVVFPSEALSPYAEIIGAGLRVPLHAEARVSKLLAPLSALVSIQSAVGGGSEHLETVEASSQPIVQLRPHGAGLSVRIVVRPFSSPKLQVAPGGGAETVMAEIDGKHLQTRRDLQRERTEAARLIDACPTLSSGSQGEYEWLLMSIDECLEVQLELGAQPQALVEWPSGRPFQVREVVSSGALSLRIAGEGDLFAVTGELRLADEEVIDLGRVLDLIEASPGRFVQLGEGEFLALTQEFRQRLDALSALSERRGKGLRLHPLTAAAIESWLDTCGKVVGDADWKRHVVKLREAQQLDPPVPETLDAELRPYQIEGYRWLTRLAYWGAGACLADDMGLGKTIQALALLLGRAQGGPALVVAPTSVCLNWIDEARRFAPTLRCVWLASADRDAVLREAGPFDVVIASYGLLLLLEETLVRVKWHTVVLDEAQAIKNMSAKRSAAAMRLQGAFKMVTTGTPMENNLGELWNLFRFINPGFLGPLDRFNERFAVPIEKNRDREAGAKLKRLVQPFILRRQKSQVLTELPARTDVVLRVDLSAEEAALYEALRKKAVEKLTSGPAGHIQVLAEIMRLRRVCCHPRLVLPDSLLQSAKLSAFAELAEELKETRHRALVFSQFVDHLAIVRAYLDEQGVRYQYLDGSTPAAERKRRVDAFQGGEGSMFLISLKAGGLGLNLTAADYVIHLDPWWNPAVEDQASDRAYRIGQTRPVTVYRIITRHTIEERIMALHAHKRDLTNRLLEGTDVSGSMSVEELLRLICDEDALV